MSFSLGWSHVLLIFLAWSWAWKRGAGGDLRFLSFLTCILLLLCFLMMPASLWLWDHLPLLKYVELPWRMLGPAAVCVALLVASLARSKPGLSLGPWELAIGLGLLILPNLVHIAPPRTFRPNLSNWSPQQIAARGIAVTTRREYQPRWLTQAGTLEASPPQVKVASGDAEVRQTAKTPVFRSLEVSARTDAVVELGLAFFPGWKVAVDDREVPVEVSDPGGAIRFQVPSGDHQVKVRFARTLPRWMGEGLSVLSVLLAFWLWWRWKGKRRYLSDTSPRA